MSDHISVLMIPAYKTLRSKTKLAVRNVMREHSVSCRTILTTETVFEHLDLQERTEAALFYIKICTDNVMVDKQIKDYNNQKPWMTTNVRSLLRAQYSSFSLQVNETSTLWPEQT